MFLSCCCTKPEEDEYHNVTEPLLRPQKHDTMKQYGASDKTMEMMPSSTTATTTKTVISASSSIAPAYEPLKQVIQEKKIIEKDITSSFIVMNQNQTQLPSPTAVEETTKPSMTEKPLIDQALPSSCTIATTTAKAEAEEESNNTTTIQQNGISTSDGNDTSNMDTIDQTAKEEINTDVAIAVENKEQKKQYQKKDTDKEGKKYQDAKADINTDEAVIVNNTNMEEVLTIKVSSPNNENDTPSSDVLQPDSREDENDEDNDSKDGGNDDDKDSKDGGNDDDTKSQGSENSIAKKKTTNKNQKRKKKGKGSRRN